MRGSLLRKLLEAYAEGDQDSFEKTAMQLASSEKEAGHSRLAEELRSIIAKMAPKAPKTERRIVDLSEPREDLAGLLEGGYRDERLNDIILTANLRYSLERIVKENRGRTELESWGVKPSRKILLFGPPGCGKTLAAQVLAGELGMPALTVRLDGLFSRYLGATAGHLKVIFQEMFSRPAVYLFDEFDALGKSRLDAQEIGELRRVVTSFLQLLDADKSNSIIVAATNCGSEIDNAVLRRFDQHLHFPFPTTEQIESLIKLRFSFFKLSPDITQKCASLAAGMTYADVARACDESIKTMALDKRSKLLSSDLLDSFSSLRTRIVQK